ncbi:MAG: sensor domain-containing diguanylate cyclase [Glaciimonas sp.]|nr:sensor domain-containing diguanylate cyclase [Glaciimonas sp.]
MINPISAQLLLPLSRDGNLENLFTALESVAPSLRHVCAEFSPSQGVICDAMYIHFNAGLLGNSTQTIASLTIVKLDKSRLMAVLSDVTLQVKRERELKQSGAWINAILTSITDYTKLSLDRLGRIDAWNKSIGRVMGFEGEALVGQPYSIFYPPEATTPEHLTDRLREADENGWSLDEGLRVRADGSHFWSSAMISPLRDRDPLLGAGSEGESNDPAYSLIIRDISDKQEASERQHKATFCDYLTGLANRRAFFEAAELELERRKQSTRPTAMIMFDADHFKTVNDRFGHPAGDAVLRHLAAALSATFRNFDVVARIGGEEFAVLLPSTELAAAVAAANRLRTLVNATPVVVDGESISYTVSAGVAAMDDSISGLDGLMKRADQALYAAKARGRNRVDCWTPDCPTYQEHQNGSIHSA